jgi:cytochrome P450
VFHKFISYFQSGNQAVDLVHQMLFSDKKAGEPMTEREIVAQSITFLLAGYETTSAVLSYLTHLLAHNQNVQKRLSEEIEEKIGQVKYKFLYLYLLTKI